MKYDFTSLMNRSGHDSIAVDQIPIPGAEVKEGFSRIPMRSLHQGLPEGCDPLPVYGKNVSEKGHRRSTVRDQKPLISSRSRSIEG